MQLVKLIVLFFCCFTLNSALKAEQIKVVTEHFPPYQIVQPGKPLSGLAVTFMADLLKATGTNSEIEAYPWARAYKMAIHQPNVLIFSLTRTQEREHLFHWVGSFNTVRDSLWSLKGSNIDIKSIKEAKQYSVVVPRDDNTHNFLIKHGFNKRRNLFVVSSREQAVKMLMNKRVDLLLSSQMLLEERVKSLGYQFSQIENELILPIENKGLSVAFSQSTPMPTVLKFQQAFKTLKVMPKYQELFASTQ